MLKVDAQSHTHVVRASKYWLFGSSRWRHHSRILFYGNLSYLSCLINVAASNSCRNNRVFDQRQSLWTIYTYFFLLEISNTSCNPDDVDTKYRITGAEIQTVYSVSSCPFVYQLARTSQPGANQARTLRKLWEWPYGTYCHPQTWGDTP